MNNFDVIVLGIVQALTEFIPVSSSGHLLLLDELTSIESSIGTDIMLHFGTLIAVVIYFWRDLSGVCVDIARTRNSHLAKLIIVGSIPAVVIGLLFKDAITDNLRTVGVVAIMLALVGGIMIMSDTIQAGKDSTIEKMTMKTAFIIGVIQTLAFVPGTSRSGVTILAGRYYGLPFDTAARFSFLLGIPAIAGATLSVMLDDEASSYIKDNLSQTILGVAVAAIVGYLAIEFILRFLKVVGLKPFGWYRIALSALLVVILVVT